MHDCCSLGGVLPKAWFSSGATVEISHSVFDSCSVSQSSGEGTQILHHNIVMRCRFAASSGQSGNEEVYNNVFYMQRRTAVQMAGSSIVNFYNNICLMDPGWAGQSYYGFVQLTTGGTLNEDHNCIRDYDDTATLYLYDTGATNQNWNNRGIGENSIEEMPLFVEADNFDFRPVNPNVITGGKPVDGVATYMGAIPPKHNFKTNARTANFGRLNIVKC